MTTKHTPGPWDIQIDDDLTRVGVYVMGENNCIACVYTNIGCDDANAHLIAAAPELLEALEMLLDTYSELHSIYDLGDCEGSMKALAAIAKAKGTGQ